MDINRNCPIAAELAARIRGEREKLTARWLERIAARVRLEADRLSPSDDLLEHGSVLMVGIADYLEDPKDEISTDTPVIAKAMEVGAMRFAQGFDATEILKEYEILGGVLFTYSAGVISASATQHRPDDLLLCAHRIFRAISVIEQITTAHYLRVLGERVGEREERLRRFSRLITHELKNRVGATLGAGQLLQEEWLADADRRRFAGMVAENAQAIQRVLENLVAMSKLDGERRRQRNIMLSEVVTEVFRQLRELARARQVQLRVVGELPEVEVNAAAVELCVSNYISNAIKYSHPTRRERWVELSARVEAKPGAGRSEGRLVVRVCDNGLGVPEEHRLGLFERFFRAHEHISDVEGTGLGLSLVRETVESMGGAAWAEFEGAPGAVFAFSLPCRRSTEVGVSGPAEESTGAEPAGPSGAASPPSSAAQATASD